MVLNRFCTWLLAVCTMLVLLLGSAQLRADEAELLEEFDEPFGWADPYPYRGYQLPNTGYFFNFDQLYWSFSKPDVVEIGAPGLQTTVWEEYGYHTGRNSMDTSWMGTDFTHGQRYEFGHQGHHWGWVASGFTLRSQTQQQVAGNVEVMFQDVYTQIPGNTSGAHNGQVGYLDSFVAAYPIQPGGAQLLNTIDQDINGTIFFFPFLPPAIGGFFAPKFGRYYDGDQDGTIDPVAPNGNDILIPSEWDLGDLVRPAVVFTSVKVMHRQQMWSTEFMPKYRFDQTHNHGTWELMGGVRYINFKDRFTFQGWGGVFDDSYWDNNAINNLIGPQIAARWYKTHGRLQFEVEPRFMAAWNFQAVRQIASLQTHAPRYLESPLDILDLPLNNVSSIPTVNGAAKTYTHGFQTGIFCPVGELRVNVGYNLTKAITLRAGWTGIVLGDIARGQSMVRYTMPGLGIKTEDGANKQTVFVQGYNLGVEVNY